MVCDQHLELTDQARVAAGLEVGVDPVLEHREVERVESSDVAGECRLEGEVLERRPSPERERLAQLLSALTSGEVLGLRDKPLESLEIELAWLGAQHVPPVAPG